MRIRTIKPDFFKDTDIPDLSFGARLLFIGLWCMSDREGRLEDDPKRIKAEIFPYDKMQKKKSIPSLLNELVQHRKKFVLRYEVQGKKMLQVRTFKKHQRISGRESEYISDLPPPETPEKPANIEDLGKSAGSTTEKSGSTTEATGKIPENSGKNGNTGNSNRNRKEEGGSLDLPPPPDGLLSQVKWIKSIRKEFEALRDVDIENALTGCPDEEARKAGMRDFGRDMLGILGALPENPTKKLRGYLYYAEKDAAKTTPPSGGASSGIENLSAEEVIERVSDALAKKGI